LQYIHDNIGKPYGVVLKKFNFVNRLKSILDVGNDRNLDPKNFDLRKTSDVYPQLALDSIESYDPIMRPEQYIEDTKKLDEITTQIRESIVGMLWKMIPIIS